MSFLPGRQRQTLRRRGLLRLLPTLPQLGRRQLEPLLPLALLRRPEQRRLVQLRPYLPVRRRLLPVPQLPRPRRLRLELRGRLRRELRQPAGPVLA